MISMPLRPVSPLIFPEAEIFCASVANGAEMGRKEAEKGGKREGKGEEKNPRGKGY
jgi:hypothetical protein